MSSDTHKTMRTILYFLVLGLFIVSPLRVAAQEPDSGACSSPMTYEDHNQVNTKPLRIDRVEGLAKDTTGSEVWSLCLALFSEKDHALVITTQTKQDGSFAFGKVPPGRYRLVARSLGFCSANTPLHVGSGSRNSKKKLLLHMTPSAVDTCSWGELMSAHRLRDAAYEHGRVAKR